MNIHPLLLSNIKTLQKSSKMNREIVSEFLRENYVRILEELTYDSGLDLLASLDSTKYLRIKDQIEKFQEAENKETIKKLIINFLHKNPDNYALLSDKENESYYMITKKIAVHVKTTNTNSPFHNYDKVEEKIYWVIFFITLNDDPNLEGEYCDYFARRLVANGAKVFCPKRPESVERIFNSIT